MRSYVPKEDLVPYGRQNKRDMWVKVDDENDSFDFPHLGFIAAMVNAPGPRFFGCSHSSR